MIRTAWRGRASVVVVMLVIGGRPRGARAADPEGPIAGAQSLVLLVQGDGVLASRPAAPDDPPAGLGLRLRRVRAGADVGAGAFDLRLVLEAAADDAAGDAFAPIEGGRLPVGGPVRVTDAYLAWRPARELRLELGSTRVPLSLSRQVDEADLRLAERPAFIDQLAPDFRVGIAAAGDLGELLYRAAVMTASPTLDAGMFDRGVLLAARLDAEPLGPVGPRPWRRAVADPWYAWWRFAAGVSVAYGTIAASRTIEVAPDFTFQRGPFVATAEYLLSHAPASGYQQGAVVEPGVTLGARRLDIVARGDWQRTDDATTWGAGAGITVYAPDPHVRAQASFERRFSAVASDWAIVRLTIAVN